VYVRRPAARRRGVHHVRSAVKLGDWGDCLCEIPQFAHRLGPWPRRGQGAEDLCTAPFQWICGMAIVSGKET
jgi:hypothetical protein